MIEGIGIKHFENFQWGAQDKPKKLVALVSNQVDAIFLQAMLKSIRMEQHFINDPNPFQNKSAELHQEICEGRFVNHRSNELAPEFFAKIERPIGETTTTANSNKRDKHDFCLPYGQIDFIKLVWPYAQKAADLLGLDPKLLIAQVALETGWGQFIARGKEGDSSHNLFNIKVLNNALKESVQVETTEYVANTPIKMKASLKKYSSFEQSFNDYVALIQENSRYEKALENTNDPQKYVHALYQAGYATDPNYAAKILAIYRGEQLAQVLEGLKATTVV